MEERARLQVTGSGELSVNERSLLLCRRGEINLEQAHVTLENASCLIIMESEMNVNAADVRVLERAVFADALCGDRTVRELTVTVDGGSEMHLSGNVTMQNAEISVEGGRLINSARYLTLGQSALMIGESGNLYNEYSAFRLSETTIRNEGSIRAHGGIESAITFNHSSLLNMGVMDFSPLVEIDDTSTIENNGIFYLWIYNDEEREQIQSRMKGNDYMVW